MKKEEIKEWLLLNSKDLFFLKKPQKLEKEKSKEDSLLQRKVIEK